MKRVLLVGLVLPALVAAGGPGAAVSLPRAAGVAEPGDFNGDGFADLAIGVPNEDIVAGDELFDAGAVNVAYGSAGGALDAGDQLWYQGAPGLVGSSREFDLFGRSVAGGDFNGDGFADLAVGSPARDARTAPSGGTVSILYGSAEGLVAEGNQLIHQDSPGIVDRAEDRDRFGWSLAAGDFDADAFEDLAVGVPFENVGTFEDAGAVHVLYGTGAGIGSDRDELFHQGTPGVPGPPATGDSFGSAIATGDFDRDGTIDLAVGVPGDLIGEADGAGAVNVLHGSGQGLTATDAQIWHQDIPGVHGVVEADDGFGSALATGNVGGDVSKDLIIGVPTEDVGAVDAGAIHVLLGSTAGLRTQGTQLWYQDSGGVPDQAEQDDLLGAAVAVGDFGRDGFGDVAVGVPGEDLEHDDRGLVHVLFGSLTGVVADANEQLRVEIVDPTLPGGEEFGHAVAASNLNGGPQDDLVVGAPHAVTQGMGQAGMVYVYLGSETGLGNNPVRYDQNRGLEGAPEGGDRLGWSLA